MTGNAQYKQESHTARNPHQLQRLSTPYKLVKKLFSHFRKETKKQNPETDISLKEKTTMLFEKYATNL